MFCKNCGEELEANVTYCKKCSAPVENANYSVVDITPTNNNNCPPNNYNNGYPPNNYNGYSANPNSYPPNNYNVYNNTYINVAQKMNPMCLAGFIISIVSWFLTLFGIVSITAIILSVVGLVQVNNDPVNQKGKGLAIAGIIIGSISALVAFWALVEIIEALSYL